jgi:hypothetical protein
MDDRPSGILVTGREWRLISAAADMMVDWRSNRTRTPFRQALLTRSETHLRAHGLTHEDYSDFRLLVNAMRTGRGHPTDNLPPLIAILRGGSDHQPGSE